MKTTTLIAAMAMLISANAIAEEEKTGSAQPADPVVAYCQQLGQTAGFENEDLASFVTECTDDRRKEAKAGSEEG